MPARAALLAGLLGAAACSAPRPEPPVHAPLPASAADAGSPADAQAAARGEVVVSLLTKDGGYWPGLVKPASPGDLVRDRCIDAPSAERPLVTGYLMFGLSLPFESGAARLRLLEASPTISTTLSRCVETALGTLASAEPGVVLNDLVLYVSLR